MLLLAASSTADARRKQAPPPPPPAGTLIENVNGYTLDKSGALIRFNGLLIDDNGRVKQLLKAGDRREPVKYRTDGKGRTLLPGFIDVDEKLMDAGRLANTPERFRNNPVELEAVLIRAQERLAQAGVTTVSDTGTSLDDWMLYRRFGDEGRLNIRIQALAEGLEVLEHIAPLRPTPWLYDGRLAMRGAVFTPAVPAGGGPAQTAAEARIRNLVSKTLMIGAQPVLRVASPAQGEVALDVYDEMLPTYGKERRYRLAYAAKPAAADQPRLLAMAGVATAEAGDVTAPLFISGMKLALDISPAKGAAAGFAGLAAAVSGGLSIQQAFSAVTSAAAHAMRAEDRIGTLEPGKCADFILVDRDIFTTSAAALPETQVMETWVGGKRVFVKQP